MYALHGPHHDIYKNEDFFSSLYYSASKAGVLGMTKWFATKYATENTNFNVISPSGVFNKQSKKFLKKYSTLAPKKKWQHPSRFFSSFFLISKKLRLCCIKIFLLIRLFAWCFSLNMKLNNLKKILDEKESINKILKNHKKIDKINKITNTFKDI